MSKFFAEVQAEIDTNSSLFVDNPSSDIAHYMQRVGFIRGMRRVFAVWEQVQQAAKSDGEQNPVEQPRQIIDYEG